MMGLSGAPGLPEAAVIAGVLLLAILSVPLTCWASSGAESSRAVVWAALFLSGALAAVATRIAVG